MKHFSLKPSGALMLLLFLAVWLAAATASDPMNRSPEAADSIELSRLESVWNKAHLRGDTAVLDGLWGEDFVVAVPKMSVLAKPEAIKIWRLGKMKFQRYQTSDLRIRVYGDAAVVTGRLQRARQLKERIVEDDWRFTKVYVRNSGRWRVVAFHASESAP
jgi:ketosteroid isomerase-like protein